MNLIVADTMKNAHKITESVNFSCIKYYHKIFFLDAILLI